MKFKSGFFKELENSPPVKVLQRAFGEGRLPHAILLHGDNLEALESVALLISVELIGCQEPKKHPDFFALRPVNKMRQISADNTRCLIKDIQHSPSQGLRKVAVIYEADRMNMTAANAFLKTLEEPPFDTTVFLLTTRPYSLLDTIRSRCLNFKLPAKLGALSDEAWLNWLEDYAVWIKNARQGVKTKQDSTRMIMGVYRLIFTFNQILKRLSEEAWALGENQLPEGLAEEEEIALQTGLQKGLRHRLMVEIEIATRNAGLADCDQLLVLKLASVIEELESCVALMEVNLNEGTALEAFMLESLRIWTR